MNRKQSRPISPHLSIYKMQLNSALSIMHRISGVFLFIGLICFLWWIVYCIHNYGNNGNAICITSIVQDIKKDSVVNLFKHIAPKIILIAWSYAMFYHLFAGIRHLLLDVGIGFTIRQSCLSGWVVLAVSLVTWSITWFILLMS